MNLVWSDLELLIHVLHRLAVAPWTSNRRHPTLIFTPEFGRTDRDVNDGFMDEHLFTADRTAVEVCLRWRAKRFVQGFQWDRLVALVTHTFLSSLPPAPHG
jgi:hypothetical protein